MKLGSPRNATDTSRPRPVVSASDFGFPSSRPAASGSGSGSGSGGLANNTARQQHQQQQQQQDPPSPRKLRHGRTTSVPNLHKLSTGGRPSPGMSHSRSRSWLATLLKPGERGLSSHGTPGPGPVPPLPGQAAPASPTKAGLAGARARVGTLRGTLRRKVEEGTSGLGLPFGAGEGGRLEFGCAGGGADDEVEELVVEAPKRPRRPDGEVDQDLICIRLREGSSPARHSTYTPTSPRNRLSQHTFQTLPPPPPYTSLLQPTPPTDPAHPSPRSHPSLTALRGLRPQSRLRPRSAHRAEAVELTREWKEALQAISDMGSEGGGEALASLLSELDGEGGGAGLTRSKRREAPVSPTYFNAARVAEPQTSGSSGPAHLTVLERAREEGGMTHSASLVSLSAFPSPPLAGAAGFIHPPSSTKSLAERRAQLVAPLLINPPSTFDDDDDASPQPGAAEAAYTPEEERGRIVFSPYRTDSIIDYGGRYSIVVERERGPEADRESVASQEEGVATAEERLCAAGRLGVNMMLGSHFSPVTNSSSSSLEGSQDGGSHVSASAGHSPTTTIHQPDLCGLEIDGLSLKQLGVDRPSSLLPPSRFSHHPARATARAEPSHAPAGHPDDDRQALEYPPSSTFTAASFSPFSGSVASFSTNPSSLDGDRDRDALTIPDNVKWRWERSGVFPSSAPGSSTGGSSAPSRSVSGASSGLLGRSARSFDAGGSVSGLSVLEYYAEAGVEAGLEGEGDGDGSLELDASQRRWEEEMIREHRMRVGRGEGKGPDRQRSEGEGEAVAWGVAF